MPFMWWLGPISVLFASSPAGCSRPTVPGFSTRLFRLRNVLFVSQAENRKPPLWLAVPWRLAATDLFSLLLVYICQRMTRQTWKAAVCVDQGLCGESRASVWVPLLLRALFVISSRGRWPLSSSPGAWPLHLLIQVCWQLAGSTLSPIYLPQPDCKCSCRLFLLHLPSPPISSISLE